MNKTIIWILVLISTISIAAALGISPAKTLVIYEETPVYAGSFWIVNNDNKNMDLVISVDGDLSSHMTIRTNEVTLNKDDGMKEVFFDLELPENLPGGKSILYIVVEQKLSETEKDFIAAKMVLKHRIEIQGPYPDKYVKNKIKFQVHEESIDLISEVENLGKQEIDQVQTTFYINDREQNEQVVKTDTTFLNKDESKVLKAEVKKSLFNKGEFEVSAITKYDDQKVELVKKMILGKPEVEVTYFDKYFVANKINPYSLDLLNKWNKEIKNVFVDVEVKRDDEKIDEFRTRSVDLPGLMMERINDYFDARDKNTGLYSFDMRVNFWNTYKMDTKTFHSELLDEEEFKERKSVEHTIVQAPQNKSYLTWGIVGVVLLLLIINTFVLLRVIKKK